MFEFIWENLLFTPLVNLLVFLYNFYAFNNYAVAIFELVIIVRIVLLPLSVIEEKNRIKYIRLDEELKKIDRFHPTDPVRRKELVREVLKRNKIRPWVKLLSLGVQALILLLLYQVNNEALHNLDRLYFFNPPPTHEISTFVWGTFDALEPYYPLALICAFYLFVKIILEQMKRDVVTESEKAYRYIFPLSTFCILALIPATKSIFILTTMFFTTVIHRLELLKVFIEKKRRKKSQSSLGEKKESDMGFSHDPWERYRKINLVK